MTVRCTMAQALVRFLNNVYLQTANGEHKFVTGFATIFGHGNVLGLGEALAHELHDFKLIQGKNEQGMAHVALGYTKQTNRTKIIACTTSVGPGAANLITAAATATANHLPLLLFPGDVFASRQPDPVLQQIEQNHNLNLSTNDAFQAVSKYWDRINRPEQLINSMLWAMNVLTNPATTGAVTICLPQDVQGEVYDYPEWFFAKRVYTLQPFSCLPAQLAATTKLLEKSHQPLIIVGGGARYSNAGKEIATFCERLFIPFATTQAGTSVLASSSFFNLGGIGVTGTQQANLYAQTADLVIGIGTKYSDFTTGSKTLFANKVQFINININNFDAMKMLGLNLVGDAQLVLADWNNLLQTTKLHFQTTVSPVLETVRQTWEAERLRIAALSVTAVPVSPEVKDANSQASGAFAAAVAAHYAPLKVAVFHQAKVLMLINQVLHDQVIVGAAGSLPGDLQRLWQTDRLNSYNLEYGYSCMGHEIQAAIGASLALNYAPVYAFCGDGSFLMLHSELHTAVLEQIPVVVLLFDNSGFGCINNLQLDWGNASFETQFHYRQQPNANQCGQLHITDFTKIAQGYGLRAYLAGSEAELMSLLEKSKTTQVPMLIEIKVYPKTMTHGYDCDWVVGVAQTSQNPATEKTAVTKQQEHFRTKQFN